MARVVKGPSGYKRVKCLNCLCLIEYAPNEVRERNGRDISGGPDGCTYIVCPNCEEWITLTVW